MSPIRVYRYFDENVALDLLDLGCNVGCEEFIAVMAKDPRGESTLNPVRRSYLIRSLRVCEFEFQIDMEDAIFTHPVLVAVALFPECRIGWRVVYGYLGRIFGVENLVYGPCLKVLKGAAMYVDEEYWRDGEGVYCLKYNRNHPTERDKIRITGV